MLDRSVRGLGAVLLGYVGFRLAQAFVPAGGAAGEPLSLALGTAVMAGVGVLVAPLFTLVPLHLLVRALRRLGLTRLTLVTSGLIAGLVIAALLAFPLSGLPGLLGVIIPIAISILLGVLGAAVTLSLQDEFGRLVSRFLPASPRQTSPDILLDTSAIIDGRVADIVRTGFLQGGLVVPSAILDELRRIADSEDSSRRLRGRRGLEVLNRLQKDSPASVRVVEAATNGDADVDAHLLRLAQRLNAPIMTNDINLSQVAEVQGIRVLNINALAKALRIAALPGEELTVRILQEGKEPGQGVGFLEDGTMVVVEGGGTLVDQTADVIVARVFQTAAGHMIFAHPKAAP